MAKQLLDECIIVSKKFGNDMVLAKNRDRAYKPEIEIVHTLINGVEVVYLHDITTDWSEGMNEYGIGIVNASLLVGYDVFLNDYDKEKLNNKRLKRKEGRSDSYEITVKNIKETKKDSVILAIQDTTDIDYTSQKHKKGLGYLEKLYLQGIKVHSCLPAMPSGRMRRRTKMAE